MNHNRKTLYTQYPTRAMFPRTLEEAFGPGATWPVDRRSAGAKVLGWLAACAPWAVLAVLWWAASDA